MIPSWNNHGVLPPIKPGMPGHSAERSPYHVTISELWKGFVSINLSPEEDLKALAMLEVHDEQR